MLCDVSVGTRECAWGFHLRPYRCEHFQHICQRVYLGCVECKHG